MAKRPTFKVTMIKSVSSYSSSSTSSTSMGGLIAGSIYDGDDVVVNAQGRWFRISVASSNRWVLAKTIANVDNATATPPIQLAIPNLMTDRTITGLICQNNLASMTEKIALLSRKVRPKDGSNWLVDYYVESPKGNAWDDIFNINYQEPYRYKSFGLTVTNYPNLNVENNNYIYHIDLPNNNPIQPAKPYHYGNSWDAPFLALGWDGYQMDPTSWGFWTKGILFTNNVINMATEWEETHNKRRPEISISGSTVNMSIQVIPTDSTYEYLEDPIQGFRIEEVGFVINEGSSRASMLDYTSGPGGGYDHKVTVKSGASADTLTRWKRNAISGSVNLTQGGTYTVSAYVMYKMKYPNYYQDSTNEYNYTDSIYNVVHSVPLEFVVPMNQVNMILNGSGINNAVRLNWNAYPGATGYKLYRSELSCSDAAVTNISTTITSGSITSFTDESANEFGKTYYYRIVPLGVTGNISRSNCVALSPLQSSLSINITSPLNNELISDLSVIDGTVTATSGIDRIWIRVRNNTTNELVIIDQEVSILDISISPPHIGISSWTFETLTTLPNGSYTVTATVDELGTTKTDSDSIIVIIGPVPQLLATDNLVRKIELHWENSSPTLSYSIYKDNVKIKQNYVMNNYTDTDVIVGQIYEYYVVIESININSNMNTGKAIDPPKLPTPVAPVPTNITTTSIKWLCATLNAVIHTVEHNTESTSPLQLTGLTPNTEYRAYAYLPTDGYNLRSLNSQIVTARTLREKPIAPVAIEIGVFYMIWSSTTPGCMITVTGPNGYNKTLPNGSMFDGMLAFTEYTGFAFMPNELPLNSMSENSDSNVATTLKDRFGTPTLPAISELTGRTVRITSNPTAPNGNPVMILCNGEIKESGSLWTWLTPKTSYSVLAWCNEDATHLRSFDSETLTFITPDAAIEPDLDIIGFMSDGSRAPKDLLDNNLVITSTNTEVVQIKGRQILVVGSGYTRIIFDVNGKTTFTDLNIL